SVRRPSYSFPCSAGLKYIALDATRLKGWSYYFFYWRSSMSLAQLFYLKEAVRKQCRQWRVRGRVRTSHSWRSRNTAFRLEPLEHRILLTVAPLPTPVDFEPGFVQPNTINLE